ncbi:MAG: hypothetical protein WBI17_01830 [Clostridiaceae bacterium]
MDKDLVGFVVKSKLGRDKNKLYIIGNVIDDYFVTLVDGKKFDFKRQKRKNKKHLCIITKADEEIILGIMNQDEKCLTNIFKLLQLEAKEV